jgi:hypothetical protein
VTAAIVTAAIVPLQQAPISGAAMVYIVAYAQL